MRKTTPLVAVLFGLFSVACGPRFDELIDAIHDGCDVCSPDDPEPEPDPGTYEVQDGGYVLSGGWSGYAWIASDEASTVAPSDFSDHAAGQPLCMSGSVAAAEDYTGYAALGLNLNQSIEDENPATWSVTSEGIRYQVSNPGGSALRMQIQGAASWPDEAWCAPLTAEEGTLAWSDFSKECWSGVGEVYDGSIPLQTVMIVVPGMAVSDVPVDLCIGYLEPTNDVVVPMSCADPAGAGPGELVPGFDVAPRGYVAAGELHGWAWTAASTGSDNGTTLAPLDFTAHPGGAPLCVNGVLGASADYEDYAMLGINLNQAEDLDAEPGVWSPSGDGIAYEVSDCAGSPLRLQIQTADGAVDENARWCANITPGQGFVPWSDFNTECWSNEGEFFDGATPLSLAAIMVPSTADQEVPYDFCVHGLTVSQQ